jgi:nucleotide-binding universal stress UspA family protein
MTALPWIKWDKKVKDIARRLVDRTVLQMIKAGFTAKAVCKLGDPAEEIRKVASKHCADLIVKGKGSPRPACAG